MRTTFHDETLRPTTGGLGRSQQQRHWSAHLLLAVLFWMTAAASFGGYAAKWGLRDDDSHFSVQSMLNEDASKPWVYRQLLPWLAREIGPALPVDIRNTLLLAKPEAQFSRLSLLRERPNLRLPYLLIYYSSFGALLACLYAQRRLALEAGCSEPAAVLAPIALVLALPYLQTVGGYFYDSVELLSLTLAALLAQRGRVLGLVLLSAPATLNKETFIFFVPTLYPLLRQQMTRRNAVGGLLGTTLVAALINITVKLHYSANPGSVGMLQLLENLRWYAQPWTYHRWEETYGLVGPSGNSMMTLIIAGALLRLGWPGCPSALCRHLVLAALISAPLFLLFAAGGELRNLSFTFPALGLLAAYSVDSRLASRKFLITAAVEQHVTPATSPTVSSGA